MQHVSWHPRAFVYHNFLSDEECDHLIKTAAPMMRRSKVVAKDGGSETHSIRTSYGTFLRRLVDPVVEAIEYRVANWTQIPIEHQEDIQVLRYENGQKYGAHYDSSKKFESPRMATVLLYLSDVEYGGETAFPKGSEWLDPKLESQFGPFSDCAKGHVAVKPSKGDALLFFSMNPDGSNDPQAMHEGCPTLKGVKWTSTVWIHTLPFRVNYFVRPKQSDLPHDPGLCEDWHEKCSEWAAKGECEKNKDYMVLAQGDKSGACRRSCKACEVCAENDRECYYRNRRSLGYLIYDENDFNKVLE